jgi:hypothetical protein
MHLSVRSICPTFQFKNHNWVHILHRTYIYIEPLLDSHILHWCQSVLDNNISCKAWQTKKPVPYTWKYLKHNPVLQVHMFLNLLTITEFGTWFNSLHMTLRQPFGYMGNLVHASLDTFKLLETQMSAHDSTGDAIKEQWSVRCNAMQCNAMCLPATAPKVVNNQHFFSTENSSIQAI